MSLYSSLNFASIKFEQTIEDLKFGLDPATLDLWYKRIKNISQKVIPEISTKDLDFVQDKILSMKFHIYISARVIPYVLFVIEKNIEMMPYSTSLYFRKVQQLLLQSLERYYLVKRYHQVVMNRDLKEKPNKISKKNQTRSQRKTKQDLKEKPNKISKKNQTRSQRKTKKITNYFLIHSSIVNYLTVLMEFVIKSTLFKGES
ncbi:MAG: hypothetical protein MRJ93_01295 [Nitrososphaeraceae archaeon]|nr:hypothetical protein [Nitrososphaeraceae archaeon]